MADRFRVEIVGDKALQRKLARMGVSTSALLGAAVQAAATVIEEAAEAHAPGPHLDQAEVERTRTRATRDVGPDKEHWHYTILERGARPHTIRGNPLAFDIGGEPVFTRIVHHPGFAARPFLRPAFDEKHQDAAEKIGKTLKKAIMAEAL